MDRSSVLRRPGGFETVVLATGHMTDVPERETPRFPEAAVAHVEAAIAGVLERWAVGANDLLVCGGARGADLLAARLARSRGATAWLLLADDPDRFEAASVAGAAPVWVEQFRHLVQRAPSWVLPHPPADGAQLYATTNEWMLDAANVQADGRPLHVLAVWDGGAADGPGGAGDLVARARAGGAAVTVIDPTG